MIIYDAIKNDTAGVSDAYQKSYGICFQQSDLAESPPMARIAINHETVIV